MPPRRSLRTKKGSQAAIKAGVAVAVPVEPSSGVADVGF